MELSELAPHPGSKRQKRRLGRGIGSGSGKTSGKGQKGQNSRSGGGVPFGFEGGQMPLHRRLPKRGFTNVFRKPMAIVNLVTIQGLDEEVIDLELLKAKGLVRKSFKLLKVLGNGELSRKVTVKANKFSRSAVAAIEAAQGTAEEI